MRDQILRGLHAHRCHIGPTLMPSRLQPISAWCRASKGDKMETVIRHATELGVSEFIPFAASRSIMRVDEKKAASKTERWQAIAKSAAMQSGRTDLAHVHQPMKLAQLKQTLSAFDAVVVCWEERARHRIAARRPSPGGLQCIRRSSCADRGRGRP